MINDKVGRRVQHKSGTGQQVKTRMFRKCDDLLFQEPGTEQVRQISRESVAIQTYTSKDKIIVIMFRQLF